MYYIRCWYTFFQKWAYVRSSSTAIDLITSIDTEMLSSVLLQNFEYKRLQQGACNMCSDRKMRLELLGQFSVQLDVQQWTVAYLHLPAYANQKIRKIKYNLKY